MIGYANDAGAAAILLRNPANFDELVDGFERSNSTDLRGKLDDALKALARNLASAPTPASAVASEAEGVSLAKFAKDWRVEFFKELDSYVVCTDGDVIFLGDPNHKNPNDKELFEKIVVACRQFPFSRDAGLEEAAKLDQRRYHRLRVLGVATGETNDTFLAEGLVRRFTSLDEFVDADLKAQPSRGEALAPTPAPASAQDEMERLGTALADAAGDIHPTAPSPESVARLNAAIDAWFAQFPCNSATGGAK